MVFAPNDDLMQIDKTWFKPKQDKQRRRVNNLCLYCGKLGHIVGDCPKKHVQHATCTITSTNKQGPKEKGNKDV
jgi:hypothetical protein